VFVDPHPPYVVRGEGCRVFDVDGRDVLDLVGNYTALIHGHAHPAIVAAAVAAINDGACFSLPTPYEIDLAAELTRRVPAAERWRFASSGTEAVMIALRLARAATGRDLVLRFDGCYHGSYDGALAPGAARVPRALVDAIISIPVGDEAALMAALQTRGEELACVLFDAMPNRAGLVPAAPEFVALLREETRKHGILLIHDEIITFRIAFGGLQSLYGLEPDITTLGKVIGGGHPIGAVGGRAELMDIFDPRSPDHLVHGGTFSANPVTMRAGLAALALLTAEEIDRINALGDRLRRALHDQGWKVTGPGSLLRVHSANPPAQWWRLYEAGVMIAGNGLTAISTAITDAEIDRALAAFASVVPDAERAEVCIIGRGAAGLASAVQLGLRGVTDVIVLEVIEPRRGALGELRERIRGGPPRGS
jgi:glutamate-1-semialdehyde 2,1-aminomutase